MQPSPAAQAGPSAALGPSTPSIAGHCLCGAVTITLTGTHDPRIGACHCRMCQRWSGGLFLCFEADACAVTVQGEVTRDRSSAFAERAFCPRCGSHLWFNDVAQGGQANRHELIKSERSALEHDLAPVRRSAWPRVYAAPLVWPACQLSSDWFARKRPLVSTGNRQPATGNKPSCKNCSFPVARTVRRTRPPCRRRNRCALSAFGQARVWAEQLRAAGCLPYSGERFRLRLDIAGVEADAIAAAALGVVERTVGACHGIVERVAVAAASHAG
jgi:hypothetical protein